MGKSIHHFVLLLKFIADLTTIGMSLNTQEAKMDWGSESYLPTELELCKHLPPLLPLIPSCGFVQRCTGDVPCGRRCQVHYQPLEPELMADSPSWEPIAPQCDMAIEQEKEQEQVAPCGMSNWCQRYNRRIDPYPPRTQFDPTCGIFTRCTGDAFCGDQCQCYYQPHDSELREDLLPQLSQLAPSCGMCTWCLWYLRPLAPELSDDARQLLPIAAWDSMERILSSS